MTKENPEDLAAQAHAALLEGELDKAAELFLRAEKLFFEEALEAEAKAADIKRSLDATRAIADALERFRRPFVS